MKKKMISFEDSQIQVQIEIYDISKYANLKDGCWYQIKKIIG